MKVLYKLLTFTPSCNVHKSSFCKVLLYPMRIRGISHQKKMYDNGRFSDSGHGFFSDLSGIGGTLLRKTGVRRCLCNWGTARAAFSGSLLLKESVKRSVDPAVIEESVVFSFIEYLEFL